MKISAVIIAFNEEENIAGAVESVVWADEIFRLNNIEVESPTKDK